MTYRNGMEASCETIAPELRNVPNSTLRREKGQNPIYILSWWTLVRKVRIIIQADILDSLGRKEASALVPYVVFELASRKGALGTFYSRGESAQ